MSGGLYQQSVNLRVEYWASHYHGFITGAQAANEFTEFAFDAESKFSIAEIVDPSYRPDRAHLMKRGLTNHRIRQLSQGARLTPSEQQLWKQTAEDLALEGDYVSINQLKSTDGVTVWFAVTMNGFHIASSITDAAGPFWSHEEAVLYCAAKVKGWFGWWMPMQHHDEVSRTQSEIEQISRTRCLDFHSLVA